MTHRRSVLNLVLLGLIALGAVACGGSDAQPSDAPAEAAAATQTVDEPMEPVAAEADAEPGTALDACEIVTAEDLAAAIDADVEPGVLEENPTVLSPGHSECTYESETARVIVSLTPEDGANLYDAAAGSYKEIEPIAGLGDGAFWSAPNRRGFVWQGKVTAMFTVFTNGDVEPKALVEELGARMIAKL
jgi:hypothetical protein